MAFGQVGQDAQRSVLSAAATGAGGKPDAKAAKAVDRAARAQAKKLKQAQKEAEKDARKSSATSGDAAKPARKLGLARGAKDEVSDGKPTKPSYKNEKYVWAAGEKPSPLNLSEWSLRRKVALVLAIPILLAAVFGGLRVRTEVAQADNYAATASQVTVLGPAVDYLNAAEHAAVVARAVGINNAKLDEAQRAVVEAGSKLVEARDNANLTPTQLRQVNDVLSLSEQMRTGMAYVSLTSMVSQVRQLERGVTQVISTIVEDQLDPEASLLVLAQALDGRLSLSLQDIQLANTKVTPPNPVELYSEFGVELASIDRLAISLGQTDPRVLAIRQANAQRLVNARGGNSSVSQAGYDAYNALIGDLLTTIDKNLADATRSARVLTWVDSAIIVLALLAALILALMVSRLLLNPIRRVRTGALEVAHERLPEAVRRIRAGEDPGEIEPIGVTTHEETGQLARAVDDLHRQAVKLASGEAELREQVGDMFVTLSRRNTSLINQQLGLIETLESDEEDPQRLESLFRLDHLAARMRRNAESLVILSGAPTRATEQDDLSLTDVLQAAIAGVQDYRRVQLDAAPAQRVTGDSAADVVHLLAELVDNALSYSPPSSKVLVTSSFTRGGVIVQVTDAGLGIADDALGELNDKLRAGGEVTPDTARRMGLFVVSRLAQRHGMAVSLDQNDRMGITATVFLPTSVLSDTARLAAGSPSAGAQVIELGAAPATADTEDREPAEVLPFGATSTATVEADVEPEIAAEPEPEPEPEPYDPITAAINAYGLPQRRPGASGAGNAGSPVSMGGGFFDRVEPEAEVPAIEASATAQVETPEEDVVEAVVAEDESEENVAEVPELTVVGVVAHEEEERAPIALGPVADPVDEAAEEEVEEEAGEPAAEIEEVEVPEIVEEPAAELEEPAAEEPAAAEPAAEEDPVVEEPVAEAAESEDHLAPVLATLPLKPSVPFEPTVVEEHMASNGNGNGNGDGNALAGLLAHGLANGASLDHPAVTTPASMEEDETPIFRSLRSNWLTADTGERPWADSEVDAGWDAADRVEATPPTRRTEAGLPMRRPGNRLIPGGLTTQTTHTVRDPEAIRARLAAHAAGVSRGRRSASPTETTANPATQEVDPA
ncbi:MAG: HAMP domain-containing sensor histidine kinase [Nocardioides sp.]